MENIGIGVLDLLFITVFIIFNIVLGFLSRSKSDDIKETVFGKKSRFSNLTLVSTLCASMITPTLVINNIQQINEKGLSILINSLLMYPGLHLIVTFFLIPRIVVTEMAFSWYEYIGKIYGKTIRIIYSICELILAIGWIAELFLTMSIIISLSLNCDMQLAKLIGVILSVILIVYSSFGGLRAVTITDIFQFFIFFSVILFLSLYFWVISPEYVHQNLLHLFDGNNEKLTWSSCFGSTTLTIATLSFWSMRLIPDFPQELYQKCYASRSLKLAKNNMLIATVIFTFFVIIINFIALQIIASNNNLNKDEVIPYFINTIDLPGVKGLFCIAVLSMAISTADSELNGTGIVFANDVLTQIKPSLKISSSLVRLSTFVIGIFAIIISYYAKSIFDICQSIGELCFPVNCFTFLAIILGMKTSKYVVYISMFTGVLPVLIYHMCGYDNYAFILGAAGNLFGLIISHLVWKYFFKSDDPNMYYNQKDNFKRLKDFEYDDDIEREKLRKEEIERQKEIELREEFKKTLNNRMKDIVEEYGYDCSEDEIEKIREHVKNVKEKDKKENKNK